MHPSNLSLWCNIHNSRVFISPQRTHEDTGVEKDAFFLLISHIYYSNMYTRTNIQTRSRYQFLLLLLLLCILSVFLFLTSTLSFVSSFLFLFPPIRRASSISCCRRITNTSHTVFVTWPCDLLNWILSEMGILTHSPFPPTHTRTYSPLQHPVFLTIVQNLIVQVTHIRLRSQFLCDFFELTKKTNKKKESDTEREKKKERSEKYCATCGKHFHLRMPETENEWPVNNPTNENNKRK